MSYGAVHKALRRKRGRAETLPCVCCRGGPCWWALQYTNLEEIVRPATGSPYSENLANYAPMCRSCHDGMDIESSPRKREALLRNLQRATSIRMAREASDPAFKLRLDKARAENSAKRRFRPRGC